MPITLNQMRYFYEVCQWQDITEAAEQLHVSPLTVSMAMQTLEQDTGLNLFHQEGKKLSLTQDGTRLLTKMKYILNQTQKLEDEIQDMSHQHSRIRLSLPLQLGPRLLPQILGDFRRMHPEIRVEILEADGLSSAHMVEEEKLDIALTNYEREFSPKVNCQKLFSAECCFCTYPEHPFAKRDYVTIEDVAQEPLILLDNTYLIYSLIQQRYANAGFQPKILHISPYLHTIKNLVCHKLGSTFLTRPALLDDDPIVAIPIKKPLDIHVSVLTKKGRRIYEGEEIFMEYLQDITRNLS